MNPAPTPQAARDDVDLHRTQRTFLFAREQVAAQTSDYCAVRRARRWVAYHEHPVITNAPNSPAR